MNRVIRVISFVLSVTLLFLAFSITASAIADSETGTYAGYSYCADVYAITGAYGSGFSYSGSTIISMVGSAKMSYGGSISSLLFQKKGIRILTYLVQYRDIPQLAQVAHIELGLFK